MVKLPRIPTAILAFGVLLTVTSCNKQEENALPSVSKSTKMISSGSKQLVPQRNLRRFFKDCCPTGGPCCNESGGNCLPDVVITPKMSYSDFSQSDFRNPLFVKNYFEAEANKKLFAISLDPATANAAEIIATGDYAAQIEVNGDSTVFLNFYFKSDWDGVHPVAEEDYVFTIPVL